MLIHCYIVYGSFPATTVELSSCKETYGSKPKIFMIWSFISKSFMTFAIG